MTPAINLIADTERLYVRRPSLEDATFILRLLNEPTWLQYIGDRNVRTLEDAQRYLQNNLIKSFDTFGFGFGIVVLKSTLEPIGICGIVRRDFLDQPDLGFALLPEFTGKGLAFEAATSIIQYAIQEHDIRHLLAFTIKENTSSHRLLQRLGFTFKNEFIQKGEKLHLYEWHFT